MTILNKLITETNDIQPSNIDEILSILTREDGVNMYSLYFGKNLENYLLIKKNILYFIETNIKYFNDDLFFTTSVLKLCSINGLFCHIMDDNNISLQYDKILYQLLKDKIQFDNLISLDVNVYILSISNIFGEKLIDYKNQFLNLIVLNKEQININTFLKIFSIKGFFEIILENEELFGNILDKVSNYVLKKEIFYLIISITPNKQLRSKILDYYLNTNINFLTFIGKFKIIKAKDILFYFGIFLSKQLSDVDKRNMALENVEFISEEDTISFLKNNLIFNDKNLSIIYNNDHLNELSLHNINYEYSNIQKYNIQDNKIVNFLEKTKVKFDGVSDSIIVEFLTKVLNFDFKDDIIVERIKDIPIDKLSLINNVNFSHYMLDSRIIILLKNLQKNEDKFKTFIKIIEVDELATNIFRKYGGIVSDILKEFDEKQIKELLLINSNTQIEKDILNSVFKNKEKDIFFNIFFNNLFDENKFEKEFIFSYSDIILLLSGGNENFETLIDIIKSGLFKKYNSGKVLIFLEYILENTENFITRTKILETIIENKGNIFDESNDMIIFGVINNYFKLNDIFTKYNDKILNLTENIIIKKQPTLIDRFSGIFSKKDNFKEFLEMKKEDLKLDYLTNENKIIISEMLGELDIIYKFIEKYESVLSQSDGEYIKSNLLDIRIKLEGISK